MANPGSLQRSDVRLTASLEEPEAMARGEGTPLCIAVLGDFSGRRRQPSPSGSSLADRKPISVDRDNVDKVLSRFGVSLAAIAKVAVTRRIEELDDFHPDRLFQNLPAFEELRDLLADLRNPATFARAAARMRSWSTGSAPSAAPHQQTEPIRDRSQTENADLLDQLLAETQERRPETPRLPTGESWQSFLQQIVAPHLLPRIDYEEQAELETVVKEAAATQMRALLNHPDFQAVEAAWRAVHFLTRRLETDSQLQLFLVDVTKAELADDLASSDDPRATAIYRVLVEQSGRRPWGILTGLFAFAPDAEDVDLLGRLGRLAQRLGAPFVAEASSRFLSCSSLAQTPDPEDWTAMDPEAEQRWQALRHQPEAAYLGLALPRFLLRLPYGKDASVVEEFDFEEMPAGASHEGYLWGNPAVACTYLLAESFRREGWNFNEGPVREITELPLHVYQEDGEGKIKPCAEVLLGERALVAMLDRGLMPLLSVRDRDTVRVVRFQSLAASPTPLAGRWS